MPDKRQVPGSCQPPRLCHSNRKVFYFVLLNIKSEVRNCFRKYNAAIKFYKAHTDKAVQLKAYLYL